MDVDVVIELLAGLKTLHDIRVADPKPSEDGTVNLALRDKLFCLLWTHVSIKEPLSILDERPVGSEDVMYGCATLAYGVMVLSLACLLREMATLAINLDIHFLRVTDERDVRETHLVGLLDEVAVGLFGILKSHSRGKRQSVKDIEPKTGIKLTPYRCSHLRD